MLAIIAAALLIVILGVIIIANLAYHTPQLPQKNETDTSSIKWDEAYNILIPSRYKYEIISISNGELNSTTALYSKSGEGDSIRVDFVTFDGIEPKDNGAGILVSTSDYKCTSRYYKGIQIPCNSGYGDYESRLAAYALPTLMGAKERLMASEVSSAIYGGRVYEAVKLVSEDNRITVWVIENIPLPARIEIYNNDGSIIIANLKSLE